MTDTSGLWRTGYALLGASVVMKLTKDVGDSITNPRRKKKKRLPL